jgi:septum formation protein
MLQDKLKPQADLSVRFSPKTTIFKDLELDFEIRLKEIEEIYPLELKKGRDHKLSSPIEI